MTASRMDELLRGVQKPGRYTGGEWDSAREPAGPDDIRFAFCFPDTYEVGMSHLGLKIIYSLLNGLDGVRCERAFLPWVDMESRLIELGEPLFALESRDSLAAFDILGFTLQYELSFTGVLHMLALAGIPLRAAERDEPRPLVIAGGPCACNPEPLADFIDLFVLGEAEEVLPELMALYRQNRADRYDKSAFLREAARIEGVYVPSLYAAEYNADGTVARVTANEGAPLPVVKRIVRELDGAYYPDKFPVPYIDIVHDRAVQEIFRGCIRGCRFCQAGFIYRPVREKSPETACTQAVALCDATGYDEVSLASLSTSDYSGIQPLLTQLLDYTGPRKISVSLPSLRIDNFPPALLEQLQSVRKSGLTFAPEAGTQRLRDVINKNITEEDILATCRDAFARGYTAVKLYFMLGLPTETMDDVAGIGSLAQKIVDCYYHQPTRPKGKAVKVALSVACFVPKPHTPFQWAAQDTPETLAAKQKHLISCLRSRKITLSYHDSETSFLEAALARGDRRLGAVLSKAHAMGSRLDGWGDQFLPDIWGRAFEECGLDPAFYANRERVADEVLPWDHLDFGVAKAYLLRERGQALRGETTPNCREDCGHCGASRWKGGVCVASRANMV